MTGIAPGADAWHWELRGMREKFWAMFRRADRLEAMVDRLAERAADANERAARAEAECERLRDERASLAYDYANQRLLCISATGQSRYLIASLSLITKRWSTFDIPAEHDSATGTDVPPTILNDYPDCYIYNGAAIYDISRPIVSASEINIITQPLHLSTGLYDLATLNELVVRGRLRRDNGVRVILYASKDGFTFVPIVASDRHFITRLRGSGYRYYIAQIAGTLQADESISAITVEATAKRTNKRHY